ncbi:hypothetical protein EZS27_011998 [termite gut metagenome]|uniref:Bacteriophage T5 Orf172 DNA-binding domain-containing protein n=1 Tax=termite gut metagenome TaxID=433724 RepID=A0A5J4S2Y3_9ZZZZ
MLRDQPYLPLYVQDFITDEKLAECSASATGVYIRLMCLMHKSEQYGRIKLKEKYKQNQSNSKNFAIMLNRHLPYDVQTIESALNELFENDVLQLNEDTISQKRMVKDYTLSEKRSISGQKGGKNVKNSNTRKLYNEKGFLYLISDIEHENVYKVGISKNPSTRLIQLSNKLNKKLQLVFTCETGNMGILEDNILNEFSEYRDGEWISGIKKEIIIKAIQKQNQSKIKANTEYENEYENEIVIENTEKGVIGEKENELPEKSLQEQEDSETPEKSLQAHSHNQKPEIIAYDELSFENVWINYGKKGNKKTSKRKWEAMINKNKKLAVDHIPRYVEATPDIQFRKNFETYINQEVWNDEILKPNGNRIEKNPNSMGLGNTNNGANPFRTDADKRRYEREMLAEISETILQQPQAK